MRGITSIAWSPNGRFLASGSIDKAVYLWDTESGQRLWQFVGHTGVPFQVKWSLDGNSISVDFDDRTVCLFDVQSGRLVQKAEVPAVKSPSLVSISLSPIKYILATGMIIKGVKLVDLSTDTSRVLSRHDVGSVTCLEWSPDGRYLASGSADGTVIIWGIP